MTGEPRRNATYLFEKPKRRFHNSESFWTSILAIFILLSSKNEVKFEIPAYRFNLNDKYWCFSNDGFLTIIDKLNYCDIIVEGKISNESFDQMIEIPRELYNIAPDILIKNRISNEIYIIEVKTIGAMLTKYQVDLYVELHNILVKNNLKCQLYFIMSTGHENDNDWNLIKEYNEVKRPFKILLWEDVFEEIIRSKCELGNCFENLYLYSDKGPLKGPVQRKR